MSNAKHIKSPYLKRDKGFFTLVWLKNLKILNSYKKNPVDAVNEFLANELLYKDPLIHNKFVNHFCIVIQNWKIFLYPKNWKFFSTFISNFNSYKEPLKTEKFLPNPISILKHVSPPIQD